MIGSETVLLVEDDEALRELARLMLEEYGYTVLLAGDGAALTRIGRIWRGSSEQHREETAGP